MTDRWTADKVRTRKWWALGLVGLGLFTQLTVLYQLKVLHDDLVRILFLSGMSLSMLGLGCYAWAKGRIVFWGLFGLIPLAGSVVALAAITSDLLSTRSPQQQRRLGLGLVILGIFSYLLFSTILPHGSLFFIGWVLPIIGLGCYARGKGYSVFWAAMGVVMIFGPPFALAAIALDARLSKRSTPKLMRRLATSVVALLGLALLLAITIPNFLRFAARGPQSEARHILGGIFVAETSFFGEVGRYGTFDEVYFGKRSSWWPKGRSTRYTYRIDNSGMPGTVFPAKDGTFTPDNTVIHAGISADGQSFTATATANLDDDPTIDQWHVNDTKRNLQKPDVNDFAH